MKHREKRKQVIVCEDDDSLGSVVFFLDVGDKNIWLEVGKTLL